MDSRSGALGSSRAQGFDLLKIQTVSTSASCPPLKVWRIPAEPLVVKMCAAFLLSEHDQIRHGAEIQSGKLRRVATGGLFSGIACLHENAFYCGSMDIWT